MGKAQRLKRSRKQELFRHGQPQKALGSGWTVSSVDPATGQLSQFVQFKPDQPVVVPGSAQQKKYLNSPGTEQVPFLLNIPMSGWQDISKRYGVPIKPNDINLSRVDSGFWRWVIKHPQVPITLTDGVKKAGSLLSHGYVGIALVGFWQGLLPFPALDAFLASGRTVNLAFNADLAQKVSNGLTRVLKAEAVNTLISLAERIQDADGLVRVVTWSLLLGRGCDDLLVANGRGEFDKAVNNAMPYPQWLASLEPQRN